MLELDGLTQRFGDVVALDHMSFRVEVGQMFGFLGPNGAGKTTAMRIVMGVLRPDVGEARWCGRPVDAEARLRFGYMPEERGLYPRMRVLEILGYLGRLHGLDAGRAAERAAHWADRLGLGDRAGARVEELSLGNQQRVQLAAALVHDPELLVLDEPFSGLDPIGVDTLGEVLLERAAAGVAVLFSSHQLDLVARFCQAVAVVDRGRVVLDGPVDELRSSGPPRLLVGVEGGATDWVWGLPGVRVVAEPDGRVLVELDAGVAPQRVLTAAEGAGALTHFSHERPTLSELFRRAVAR